MNEAELFRFPEEAADEAALRAMPTVQLLAALEACRRRIPLPASCDRLAAQAGAILSVMQERAERFLRAWRGSCDVFGHVQNAGALYRDFCTMQTVLEEGVQRLAGIAAAPEGGAPLSARENWVVTRLAQGLVSDVAVTDAAKAVRRRQKAYEAAKQQESGRREALRSFLRTVVPAYCERALRSSDACGGGARMEAGALCALVAEFVAALADCKKDLTKRAGCDTMVAETKSGGQP